MKKQEIINKAGIRALHSFADANIRWAVRKKNGLSDNKLKEAIAEELGISGGFAGGGLWYDYKGGRCPEITVSKPITARVKGKRLIVMVRELLQIPEANGQLSLF